MTAPSGAPLTAFYALLDLPAGADVTLQQLDILDWGQTLIFSGMAGDQPFTLRYHDCRELRWRVYVGDRADSTPLVSFAPGRDQQRSPAQFLTAHFGLSLYYGSLEITRT
jgi:hypothetical protein